MEQVILVNENDIELGYMNKLEAHEKGLLHRAFSVFIFNSNNELLLQQRAISKYHSAGLWSNTCCSHPRPHESILEAAARRLKEEMGLECNLLHAFTHQYKVTFDNGLTENEIDHVFMGVCNNNPTPDTNEAMNWKFVSMEDVRVQIEKNPDNFTVWFPACFNGVYERILTKKLHLHR
jgi:isopentenyl-diphosphate delta-isomerase